MNRITLLLILVMTFSCKNEKKRETDVVDKEAVEKKYKIVKSFTNDDLINWKKNRVDLIPVTNIEYNDTPYHLLRNTNTESAYLTSDFIPVTYASEYRVSIVVKKGTNTNLFGLRICGTYPDRVDAIFDLDKGKVVEYKTAQDFANPTAVIERLSGGRFSCTLSAEVSADNIRIIMGATSAKKSVTSWEGRTEIQGDIYFSPSSIII